MTALDRLIAAVNDDGPVSREAQLALVDDLLNRRYRREAPSLRAAVPPVEQTWTCENCRLDYDEPYCSFCAANLMPQSETTNAPRRNLLGSATRGRQEDSR